MLDNFNERISITAVLVGCLVTFISYEVLFFVSMWVDVFLWESTVPVEAARQQSNGTVWTIREVSPVVPILQKMIASGLGGFVTGKIAKFREQFHAVVMVIALSLIQLSVVQFVFSDPELEWDDLGLFAFLTVLGILCALVGAKFAAKLRVAGAKASK